MRLTSAPDPGLSPAVADRIARPIAANDHAMSHPTDTPADVNHFHFLTGCWHEIFIGWLQ